MNDFLSNGNLESLLRLPINLYIFTRMIVNVKDASHIQKIKSQASDQVGIHELFFDDQFDREVQTFIDAYIKD